MHLMKELFTQHLEEYKYDPEELALVTKDENEVYMLNQSIKIPSVQLFQQLGSLFNKELRQMQVKNSSDEKKMRLRVPQNEDSMHSDFKSQIHKHLLMDDHAMGIIDKETQIKIGAFLTNLMCQNLKYNVGRKSFLLLKPQLIRS